MPSYQEIADRVIDELRKHTGWIGRYKKYYNLINPDSDNAIFVTEVINSFHVTCPLTKYLSIGRFFKSTNSINIDLRINGHSIAEYRIKITDVKKAFNEQTSTRERRRTIREHSKLVFRSKGLTKVEAELGLSGVFSKYKDKEIDYYSSLATDFRKMVKKIYTENNYAECSIESYLLSAFSKRRSAEKPISYIKPVKLCDAFFQLVTPIMASSVEKNDSIKYSKDKNNNDSTGGGIDILARIKNSKNRAELCVIELKDDYDEKEKPIKAIKQAIAYATFLDRLIRCDEASGLLWYKRILGMDNAKKGKIKGKIKIDVIIAMPYKDKTYTISEEDASLAGQRIDLEGGDWLELHYFFFDKDHLTSDMKPKCSLITYAHGN